MAVPKRKMSRSNTRSRRSQWKAQLTELQTVRVQGRDVRIPRRLVKASGAFPFACSFSVPPIRPLLRATASHAPSSPRSVGAPPSTVGSVGGEAVPRRRSSGAHACLPFIGEWAR